MTRLRAQRAAHLPAFAETAGQTFCGGDLPEATPGADFIGPYDT